MKLSMTTREIASLTGREHKNVLADARRMLDKLGIEQSSVLSFDNSGANGRRVEFFTLDRDLTMTLVTGYDVAMRHRVMRRSAEERAPTTRAGSAR